MAGGRRSSFETKLAMFWAVIAAQCAGETHVTTNRIVVSLLRTYASGELCRRLHIAPAAVIDAVENPHALSFEECERRVMSDLAARGLEFASKEHRASVPRWPLEPSVKGVFDAVIDQHGALSISPLELLRDVIHTDAALAQRLAIHGVTAESIDAALEEQ